MNTHTLRRNAEHCLAMASQTHDETERARFLRAAKAWRSLAEAKEEADTALLPDEVAMPLPAANAA